MENVGEKEEDLVVLGTSSVLYTGTCTNHSLTYCSYDLCSTTQRQKY